MSTDNIRFLFATREKRDKSPKLTAHNGHFPTVKIYASEKRTAPDSALFVYEHVPERASWVQQCGKIVHKGLTNLFFGESSKSATIPPDEKAEQGANGKKYVTMLNGRYYLTRAVPGGEGQLQQASSEPYTVLLFDRRHIRIGESYNKDSPDEDGSAPEDNDMLSKMIADYFHLLCSQILKTTQARTKSMGEMFAQHLQHVYLRTGESLGARFSCLLRERENPTAVAFRDLLISNPSLTYWALFNLPDAANLVDSELDLTELLVSLKSSNELVDYGSSALSCSRSAGGTREEKSKFRVVFDRFEKHRLALLLLAFRWLGLCDKKASDGTRVQRRLQELEECLDWESNPVVSREDLSRHRPTLVLRTVQALTGFGIVDVPQMGKMITRLCAYDQKVGRKSTKKTAPDSWDGCMQAQSLSYDCRLTYIEQCVRGVDSCETTVRFRNNRDYQTTDDRKAHGRTFPSEMIFTALEKAWRDELGAFHLEQSGILRMQNRHEFALCFFESFCFQADECGKEIGKANPFLDRMIGTEVSVHYNSSEKLLQFLAKRSMEVYDTKRAAVVLHVVKKVQQQEKKQTAAESPGVLDVFLEQFVGPCFDRGRFENELFADLLALKGCLTSRVMTRILPRFVEKVLKRGIETKHPKHRESCLRLTKELVSDKAREARRKSHEDFIWEAREEGDAAEGANISDQLTRFVFDQVGKLDALARTELLWGSEGTFCEELDRRWKLAAPDLVGKAGSGSSGYVSIEEAAKTHMLQSLRGGEQEFPVWPTLFEYNAAGTPAHQCITTAIALLCDIKALDPAVEKSSEMLKDVWRFVSAMKKLASLQPDQVYSAKQKDTNISWGFVWTIFEAEQRPDAFFPPNSPFRPSTFFQKYLNRNLATNAIVAAHREKVELFRRQSNYPSVLAKHARAAGWASTTSSGENNYTTSSCGRPGAESSLDAFFQSFEASLETMQYPELRFGDVSGSKTRDCSAHLSRLQLGTDGGQLFQLLVFALEHERQSADFWQALRASFDRLERFFHNLIGGTLRNDDPLVPKLRLRFSKNPLRLADEAQLLCRLCHAHEDIVRIRARLLMVASQQADWRDRVALIQKLASGKFASRERTTADLDGGFGDGANTGVLPRLEAELNNPQLPLFSPENAADSAVAASKSHSLERVLLDLGNFLNLKTDEHRERLYHLHWSQLRCLTMLTEKLLPKLSKHTHAQRESKLDAIRSMCIYRPELMSYCKQLETVILNRRLKQVIDRRVVDVRLELFGLLEERWGSVLESLDGASVQMLAKIFASAGSENASVRGRQLLEELHGATLAVEISPAGALLGLEFSELSGSHLAKIAAVCSSAGDGHSASTSSTTGSGSSSGASAGSGVASGSGSSIKRIVGGQLARVRSELFACGRAWKDVHQDAAQEELYRDFLQTAEIFSLRVDCLHQRLPVLNQLLERGWRWASASTKLKFSALAADKMQPCAPIEEELDMPVLEKDLRVQNSFVRNIWGRCPVFSLVDPTLLENEKGAVFPLLRSIPIRVEGENFEVLDPPSSGKTGDFGCAIALPHSVRSGDVAAKDKPYVEKARELHERRVRSDIRVDNFGAKLCGRLVLEEPGAVSKQTAGVWNLLAGLPQLTVIKSDSVDIGAAFAKLLITLLSRSNESGGMAAPRVSPDLVFSCSESTRSVAIDGLFFRLDSDFYAANDIIILSTPEFLPTDLQEQLSKRLVEWVEQSNASSLSPRILVLVGEVSPIYLSLCAWRSRELENELAALYSAESVSSFPVLRGSNVEVFTGAPLTGKTTKVKNQDSIRSRLAAERRILVSHECTEEEFARQLRELFLEKDVESICVDFGQCAFSEKAYRLGVFVVSLCVFGVAGQQLSRPCVWRPPGWLLTDVKVKPIHFELCRAADFPGLALFPRQACVSNRGEDGASANGDQYEGTNAGAASVRFPKLEELRQNAANVESGQEEIQDEDVIHAITADLISSGVRKQAGVLNEKKGAASSVVAKSDFPFSHTADSLQKMIEIMAKVLPFLRGAADDAVDVLHGKIVMLVGETGTGKTYTLQKLVDLLLRTGLREIRCSLLSLSHAFSEAQLHEFARDVAEVRTRCAMHIIILDEVNATPALDFCKQLLIDRKYGSGLGARCLPSNVLFLATCNPAIGREYNVYKLPGSLEVSRTQFPTLSPEKVAQYLHLKTRKVFVDAVQRCQALLKPVAPTSLRDATRCIDLFHDLKKHLLTHCHGEIGLAKDRVDSYAEVLALYLSYGVQISPRKKFHEGIAELYGRGSDGEEYFSKSVLTTLGNGIFEQIGAADHVVPTDSLLENLVVLICCVTTCWPCLLLGDEGGSKSMSISLVTGAMKGPLSQKAFFKKLPRLEVFRLQLGATTTASHIQKLTDCVGNWLSRQRSDAETDSRADSVGQAVGASSEQETSLDTLSLSHAHRALVILEELGMARLSPSRPLKALHHLLDRPKIYPSEPKFAFIATANYCHNAGQDNSANASYTDREPVDGGRGGAGGATTTRANFLMEDPVDNALINRLVVSRSERLEAVRLEDFCIQLAGSSSSGVRQLSESMKEVMRSVSNQQQCGFSFVRDVMAFARATGMRNTVNINISDCVLLFWVHLQSLDKQQTEFRWERYKKTLGTIFLKNNSAASPLLERPVPLADALRSLLYDEKQVVRHCLVPYRTAEAVTRVLNAIHEAVTAGFSAKRLKRDAVLWCRCDPSLEVTEADIYSRLLDVKAALETGQVVVLLNPPAAVLNALHAVLNADYGLSTESGSTTTTINYDCLYEDVPIHLDARIILLSEEAEIKKHYHPAILSRVSILHPDNSSERADESSALRVLSQSPERDFFESAASRSTALSEHGIGNRRGGNSGAIDLTAVLREKTEKTLDILRRLETTLDDVLQLPIAETDTPRTSIVVTRGSTARYFASPRNEIVYLQAMSCSSLASFNDKVRELRQKAHVVVIDFFGCSLVRTLDFFLSLGLGGRTFLKDYSRAESEPVMLHIKKLPKSLVLIVPPIFAPRLHCRCMTAPAKSNTSVPMSAGSNDSATAATSVKIAREISFFWIDEVEPSFKDFGALSGVFEPHRIRDKLVSPRVEHCVESFGRKDAALARGVVDLFLEGCVAEQTSTVLVSADDVERCGSLRAVLLGYYSTSAQRALAVARPWLQLCIDSKQQLLSRQPPAANNAEQDERLAQLSIEYDELVLGLLRESTSIVTTQTCCPASQRNGKSLRRFFASWNDAQEIATSAARNVFPFAPELVRVLRAHHSRVGLHSREAVAHALRLAYPTTALGEYEDDDGFATPVFSPALGGTVLSGVAKYMYQLDDEAEVAALLIDCVIRDKTALFHDKLFDLHHAEAGVRLLRCIELDRGGRAGPSAGAKNVKTVKLPRFELLSVVIVKMLRALLFEVDGVTFRMQTGAAQDEFFGPCRLVPSLEALECARQIAAAHEIDDPMLQRRLCLWRGFTRCLGMAVEDAYAMALSAYSDPLEVTPTEVLGAMSHLQNPAERIDMQKLLEVPDSVVSVPGRGIASLLRKTVAVARRVCVKEHSTKANPVDSAVVRSYNDNRRFYRRLVPSLLPLLRSAHSAHPYTPDEQMYFLLELIGEDFSSAVCFFHFLLFEEHANRSAKGHLERTLVLALDRSRQLLHSVSRRGEEEEEEEEDAGGANGSPPRSHVRLTQVERMIFEFVDAIFQRALAQTRCSSSSPLQTASELAVATENVVEDIFSLDFDCVGTAVVFAIAKAIIPPTVKGLLTTMRGCVRELENYLQTECGTLLAVLRRLLGTSTLHDEEENFGQEDSDGGVWQLNHDEVVHPLRNFFLRTFLFHGDENGLGQLRSIARLFGDFADPVFSFLESRMVTSEQNIHARMQSALSFLPGYSTALEAEMNSPRNSAPTSFPNIVWARVLDGACPDLVPRCCLRENDAVLQGLALAARPELDFLFVPFVLWKIRLSAVLNATSPFRLLFREPQRAVSATVLPGQADAAGADIARMRHALGITQMYRCQCGYLYGLGDCGEAWVEGVCPQCRAAIGGRGHVLVGTSRRVPMGTLTALDPGFVEPLSAQEVEAGVRSLGPESYRLSQVLLLMSVFASDSVSSLSPEMQRKYADALRENFTKWQQILGLSTQKDAAQLLAVLVLRFENDALNASITDLQQHGQQAEHARNTYEAEYQSAISRAMQPFSDENRRALLLVRMAEAADTKIVTPLDKLTDAHISKLPRDEQSRSFAPTHLKVGAAPCEQDSDDGLMRSWAALAPEEQASLPFTRMLLFGSSDEVQDYDTLFRHFPALVSGLRRLQEKGSGVLTEAADACDDTGASLATMFGCDAAVSLEDFRHAWNAVSTLQVQFECQAGLSVPTIESADVPARNFVLLTQKAQEACGMRNLTLPLLTRLVNRHNELVDHFFRPVVLPTVDLFQGNPASGGDSEPVVHLQNSVFDRRAVCDTLTQLKSTLFLVRRFDVGCASAQIKRSIVEQFRFFEESIRVELACRSQIGRFSLAGWPDFRFAVAASASGGNDLCPQLHRVNPQLPLPDALLIALQKTLKEATTLRFELLQCLRNAAAVHDHPEVSVEAELLLPPSLLVKIFGDTTGQRRSPTLFKHFNCIAELLERALAQDSDSAERLGFGYEEPLDGEQTEYIRSFARTAERGAVAELISVIREVMRHLQGQPPTPTALLRDWLCEFDDIEKAVPASALLVQMVSVYRVLCGIAEQSIA